MTDEMDEEEKRQAEAEAMGHFDGEVSLPFLDMR